ncbi:hypothetical protein EW146_g269 [Bondarzewia mesenterica]|uniref:AA9 family lytic polysaccharide monooxygenase n=1 Tax=Bondarzewia mesenterica TaxID=1095465 RepID=A0A4S4M9H0_9AGAM|nr:hypothetical protein EW146_g269 [Bondarzewia mesenterica]
MHGQYPRAHDAIKVPIHIFGERVHDDVGPLEEYHTSISPDIITVPAGATLTTEWHHTFAGADPSDSADPIDTSHKDPIMSYLVKINNATQTDVTGLKWFKIYEDGYDPSTGKWAANTMIANKGKVTFTVPSCIEPGQYLIRHELIALHVAGSYPGAQFYMECAQPATVSFPGDYEGSDPALPLTSIRLSRPTYTIPGTTVGLHVLSAVCWSLRLLLIIDNERVNTAMPMQ